jgi:hypothetical protein
MFLKHGQILVGIIELLAYSLELVILYELVCHRGEVELESIYSLTVPLRNRTRFWIEYLYSIVKVVGWIDERKVFSQIFVLI